MINTPNDAKRLAATVSAQCFNDEIRAIVARELLRAIVPHVDEKIADALRTALAASGSLVAAYDQQYRD
jgi:hypothetical protein